MRQGRWAGWLVGLLGAAACADPSLDLPRSHSAAAELTFQPAAELSAVPAVFRGRLHGIPSGRVPWLFRGELSDHYDRAVRNHELPATLLERAVPLRYWQEDDDYLLQPLVWLEPGESHTLALTGHGRAVVLRVSDATSARATRFFPPPGSAKHGSAVLCGAEREGVEPAVTLEPGAVPVQVLPGAFGVELAGCFTLVAGGALLQPAVAPAALGGVLLEPSAFIPAVAGTTEDGRCEMGSRVAGACLEVEDDRIFVTPLGDDALWLLEQPSAAPLSLRAFERGALLRGLPPRSRLELRGQVVSSTGVSSMLDLAVTTAAPRRHLVLSEVLANALGPEPDSEWIELVNDSHLSADLSGAWLEDSGGRVRLPVERLEPGETVLLVGAGFRASGLDVPIPQGVRVLELTSLGQRGLSNSGEALLLVGAEGVLSRFPLLAATHAGKSMARRALHAADDDAQGFAEHGGPGASPGVANFFD